MNNVGNNLYNRRKELRLTMEDVANELGVHKSTVKRYESGETSNMTVTTLESLSKILQCNPE